MTKASRQESDLREFMRYEGELSAAGNVTQVTFQVRIQECGEIQFEIDAIPLTSETVYIKRHWHGEGSEFGYFALRGTAADGTQFTTSDLYFTTIEEADASDHGLQMRPIGGCSYANFHRKLLETSPKPILQVHLKGFRNYGQLDFECPLGRIVMSGKLKVVDPDTLTGFIAVMATDSDCDPRVWRQSADKLVEHVRWIMSFASAVRLRAPVSEFRFGDTLEVEAWSQTVQAAAPTPVIHFLNQQGIFEAAVKSFFEPPIAAKNLPFAIEWFAMETNQNELRLINVMTALENLVSSNLLEEEIFIRPANEFKQLRDELKETIKVSSANWANVDESAAKSMRADLYERLNDLNRRSIFDKIKLLATRWAVPLNGIEDHQIMSAKKARDLIVHRGHYYEITQNDSQALWDHVTIVREVFVRFFLTAISYQGQYHTYVGGYHQLAFPPTATN